MHYTVFDIETSNQFSEVGSSDPTALDISIVGIFDSATNSYTAYEVSELPSLWPLLEQTGILVGYNSDHFDIPLLNKYYPGDLSRVKSIDLMKEIKNVIGRRLKLDTVAEATLGTKKSGHGLDAITWWRNGDVEKVKQYCIDDVRITKELYDYARANGMLKYKDMGVVKDIPLDTGRWDPAESSAMTHTLPF